ncbi:ABC transporter substrate-binding protein [Pleomorphomonas sp. NRK JP5]|nr:ABC transporter substrate-binding protein [Pleomorphomonas sp. JP5]MCM5559192.1 ABC transporter substrate-binding protein [Pleomorphomonas sp. JP5]
MVGIYGRRVEGLVESRKPPVWSLRKGTRDTIAGALGLALVVTANPACSEEGGRSAARIVSIGGAVTEILYALGAEERIVATDTTSVYPPEANGLPKVGYMRQLAAEGVLSVKPDLILAVEGSGPQQVLGILEESAVPIEIIADAQTPQGVLKKIEAVGAAVGKEAEAKALEAEVAADFAALAAEVAAVAQSNRKKVLFVLSLANGKAMVGGKESSADAMISLAGGINAASGISGFKPMTDEAVIAAEPDVILVMQTSSHALDADAVFTLPAFKATPAAESRAFISMGGNYLLGFGPRAAQAARDLAAKLYPDRIASQ